MILYFHYFLHTFVCNIYSPPALLFCKQHWLYILISLEEKFTKINIFLEKEDKVQKRGQNWSAWPELKIDIYIRYIWSLIENWWCSHSWLFLGAKAPLGPLDVKVKVKVKVKPKKLRNSMILPKLIDDG